MKLNLAYGKKEMSMVIPDANLKGIVVPPLPEGGGHELDLVRQALSNPVRSSRLTDIIKQKKANSAVIIVNDITRPTPYRQILPPLLEEMESAGIEPGNIKLVVALGIHRAHTEAENRDIFGEEVCRRYTVENHDCDHNLVSLGHLSNGMELIINRSAAEADLLVTTGLVNLHYFAGYSGGRKSILPGVAARTLIEANHRMMSEEKACLGNYRDNPVNDIMLEGARQAGVDFIVNVVTTGHESIVYAAAGDLYHAWMDAVKYCEAMNVVDIDEKADIVIAGCGGYPKDINVYQAQKALDAAVLAVKEGGTIILAAQCPEGMGEEVFARWIEQASCPADIEKRFVQAFELGGHKAYAICRVLEQAGIILVSDLPVEAVTKMFVQPAADLQEALSMAMTQQGDNASILVLPEAPRTGIKIRG